MSEDEATSNLMPQKHVKIPVSNAEKINAERLLDSSKKGAGGARIWLLRPSMISNLFLFGGRLRGNFCVGSSNCETDKRFEKKRTGENHCPYGFTHFPGSFK